MSPSPVGKAYKAYENQVRKAVHPAAVKIVQGRLIDAVGWWNLRQSYSRADLVSKGIISRAASYKHEAKFEALFGAPVSEVSRSDVNRFIAAIGSE